MRCWASLVMALVLFSLLAGVQAQDSATLPKPAETKPATAPTATPSEIKGLSLSDKGLKLSRNTLIGYTITYPKIIAGSQKGQSPSDVKLAKDGRTATLKYLNNVGCEVTLAQNGEMKMNFTALPRQATVRLEMNVSYEHNRGGRFGTGGEMKPFPAEKQAKPHLVQERSGRFDIENPRGGIYSIAMPANSYQQLVDCRHWNDWHNFIWSIETPIAAGAATMKIQVQDLAAAKELKAVVDEFGQSTETDWPDKVKFLEELKADVEKEKAYYAQFKTVSYDEYGGLAGSGQRLGLKASGYFHVEKANNRWYLVDPAGNAFFHLGLCSFGTSTFTYIEGRKSLFAWIPPAKGEYDFAYVPEPSVHTTSISYHLVNQIRKYGPQDIDSYYTRMIERVRRIGFNSTGAFSGSATKAHRELKFPYVTQIGGTEIKGLQRLWDPFDEKTREKIVAGFEKRAAERTNDPLLIGYFLANEPLFEDVPRVIPTLKGNVAAKRALVTMIKERYATIDDFNKAWETKAESFDALNDAVLIVRTKDAAKDMDAYYELFLETFFKFSHDTIRKYSPNHMIIGARFQPGTASSEKACRIAGKYVDVFSLNYYTYGIDTDYLAKIQEWIGGKPMMFTEFFFDSPSDSGLGGGFKEVASQDHRGKAYRHYVEHAAALPYVVGIEWYVLVDNPVLGIWWGKYGGIRDNNGVFSVADRPWKPLVEAMAETNRRVYDLMEGKEKPFVFDDPRFTGEGRGGTRIATIGRATEAIKVTGTATGFPGLPPEQISSKRLVQGMSADGLAATFRLAYDDQKLHVLVDVADTTPMKNTRKAEDLWQGDCVELYIASEELNKPGGLLFTDRHILLSAAQVDGKWQCFFDNSTTQPEIEMTVVPRTTGDGYVLQAAIPFSALGFTPKVNQQVLFDVAIDGSAKGDTRQAQLMWNGKAMNSRNRTSWGRAKFIE